MSLKLLRCNHSPLRPREGPQLDPSVLYWGQRTNDQTTKGGEHTLGGETLWAETVCWVEILEGYLSVYSTLSVLHKIQASEFGDTGV